MRDESGNLPVEFALMNMFRCETTAIMVEQLPSDVDCFTVSTSYITSLDPVDDI